MHAGACGHPLPTRDLLALVGEVHLAADAIKHSEALVLITEAERRALEKVPSARMPHSQGWPVSHETTRALPRWARIGLVVPERNEQSGH